MTLVTVCYNVEAPITESVLKITVLEISVYAKIKR